MSKEDLELTIEGKAKLEAELDELINVRRPENVEALRNTSLAFRGSSNQHIYKVINECCDFKYEE